VKFERSYLPLRHLWTSPFVRWQGSIADVSSNDLALTVTASALKRRAFDFESLSSLVFGQTIPQNDSFYAVPYLASRLGAGGLSGPHIAQACATSVACIVSAAQSVELSSEETILVVTTDRTSNGPLLIYPNPSAPGGAPQIEHWVLDNFSADPGTGQAMGATAEAVASEGRFSRQAVDEMTLLRYQQYEKALASEGAFQRRYFEPIMIKAKRGPDRVIDRDEGIHPYTAEGLAGLKPMAPNGVVTFGNQTHPADGCAGALVSTLPRARSLGGEEGLVRLVSAAFARTDAARMPKAATLAAQKAVQRAGLRFRDLKSVTTHNPFAVNDLWFCQQTEYPAEKMNPFGSSLIFGHPQGPTGLRSIAELAHALRLEGGGYGLFTGCAAGDTGAALVIEVME
jgi:acetyl-CoA C-acetyltransferase